MVAERLRAEAEKERTENGADIADTAPGGYCIWREEFERVLAAVREAINQIDNKERRIRNYRGSIKKFSCHHFADN